MEAELQIARGGHACQLSQVQVLSTRQYFTWKWVLAGARLGECARVLRLSLLIGICDKVRKGKVKQQQSWDRRGLSAVVNVTIRGLESVTDNHGHRCDVCESETRRARLCRIPTTVPTVSASECQEVLYIFFPIWRLRTRCNLLYIYQYPPCSTRVHRRKLNI